MNTFGTNNNYLVARSCSRQLAAKTSSSKKRKISTRQSSTKDDSLDRNSSPDTPIQSCEQDTDPTFSLSASSDSLAVASPAYHRADSIPPASSLPPRLQTNTSSLGYVDYASSAASSPSGAYADLTINSDRGADTPAPELGLGAATLHPPGRASSPFAKTTHHRAVMGGAAEFPDRASSPLKRRASSMEPDTVDQDATEDVDMITAPASDASHSDQPSETMGTDTAATSVDSTTESQKTTTEEAEQMTGVSSSARQPPSSIEAHVKAIRTLVEEQNAQLPKEGQECFLVSKSWLAKVPNELSPKYTLEDWKSIPPVDNSDIIQEVISDPCVGDGVDILKRKFVRLKQGYDTEQFEPFPKGAWELLLEWPGLKDGQIPIQRFAHGTKEDGTNVMWEWHPPVLSIYRVWSANSELPVHASMKANNPPPARLVRSRSTKFQNFLKQAKRVADIDLSQRVRAWSVLQPPIGETGNHIVLTPPSSENDPESSQPQPWKHLLLDVESFVALERGSERELIDFSDMTNQHNAKTVKTLGFFSVAQDQAIVLDPHESGNSWTTTLTTTETRTSLPSTLPSRANGNASNRTTQNRNTRSGRTSPVSLGPLTRGRSQRSGRVPGCVGLSNLGNTCYMNAALQCVRSVEELTKYFLAGEWKKELNRENVLSHNGEVAKAYALLLDDIYKDSAPGSVSPRNFKTTIGRYSTGFSGYGQQDTQEFLGFLLDGLQEDLSRIKKKPYIEKPDSTDEMVNDSNAIREMAEKVWDITKKRDDSVIADLFTGLYKSTLVCPDCGKVSITFDPFNNLTLPLPVENKWTHTVRFFPLNDRPIEIRVELDKYASIKGLKEFLSIKTGVPVDRLVGAEEWKGRFYKYYSDPVCVSEEIATNDHVHFFELEAKPTNYGSKTQSKQKFGMPVRSLVDEEEHNASASWDDELAGKLLVPVFHRRLVTGKTSFHRMTESCTPHFIIVTPEEARSEDAICRKILEKVATFTKHPFFSRAEESDTSDNTDPEIIGLGGSDAGSSNESRVVAQSVKGEDDMVDVQMKDAGDSKNAARSNPPSRYQYSRKRPSWVDSSKFLPPQLQNLFEMTYYSESGASLPTGTTNHNDDRQYPKLSTRAPVESPSSEDQFDNATNGTASNEESSSDDAPRRNSDQSLTRMNEESDEEDASPINKPVPHHKHSKPTKFKGKHGRGQKYPKAQKSYGKGGGKKKSRQQQRQHKEREQHLEIRNAFDMAEPGPDGGPLIRPTEAIVVDWSEKAYNGIFSDENGPIGNTLLSTWDDCETLPDPELDKAQAARTRRRKHGISLEACLDEFEREEVLSEQDMWYCPRCKEHRRATKKFDLWKTPDILIIHLKRFSSSGFRRDKLEVMVDYPLENLDITSRVLQKEDGKQEIYDLIGVDLHWGGLGGGHYTAHAKNFVNGQWYTYNDSSVSPVAADRIVESAAYLLFYRRRSDKPLGGPRFQQILELFLEEPELDNDEQPDSGEGRRLGEGFSQTGSSSALQGAGATPPHAKAGGNSTMDLVPSNINGIVDNTTQGVHQSIEEDEAIDVTEDTTRPTGLPSYSSWSFDKLPSNDGTDLENVPTGSPFDSGAASDEAQHNSSDDERVLSPHNLDFESEPDFPGTLSYTLPQPESSQLSYNEQLPPEYHSGITRDETQQIWDHKQEIHAVPPDGETEARSEEAAEIHLDENDKIKLG